MGGSASMNRCHRFVDEFNADFVKTFGLPSSMVCCEELDVGQGLGVDKTYRVVRFYATLWVDMQTRVRTVEVTLPEAGVWDPDDPEEGLVQQLKEYLAIPKREARLRLKKADLL